MKTVVGDGKLVLRRILTKNVNDSEGQKYIGRLTYIHILLSLSLNSRVHYKASITESSLACTPVVSDSAHPPVSG